MKKNTFIKYRATESEKALANAVAQAVGKDLSTILRSYMKYLAKRHGVKEPTE